MEKVIVSGGSANMLGIIQYIQEQTGLPVVKANPFSKIRYPSAMEPLVGDLGPEFAVAIGLGIKPFS